MPRLHRKKLIDVASAIVLLALAVLDAALWKNIVADRAAANTAARLYFFPVAQGNPRCLCFPTAQQ